MRYSRKWPQALAVTLRHDPTTGRRCQQGRGERGDGEPRAQRQARRLGGDPRRGADRARRARLRAADASCAASGPGWSGWCCPSCRTRSSPPSPRWSAARSPSRGSPRCCARRPPAASPRPTTSSCCSQQHVSGVVFAGGNLRARRDAPHEHYARLADRRLPAVLINAAIDGAAASRGSPATTRWRSSRRWAT